MDLGADVLYETVLELDEKGLEYVHIQVDGGINRATIDEVLAAGANIIVQALLYLAATSSRTCASCRKKFFIQQKGRIRYKKTEKRGRET